MNTPIAATKTEDSDFRILTDIELDEVSGGLGWPSWRTTLLLIAVALALGA
jgi:hypothetical protein